MQTERYDRAIVRLEEARTRYPSDPRVSRARFQLAEAYRLSAARIAATLDDPKNQPQRDQLIADYRNRLRRARSLYDEVIARHAPTPGSVAAETARTTLDDTCVRLAYFYRADCVFDEQEFAGAPGQEGYSEAIRLYNEAAWKYRLDPISLSAYVQMIHAYMRLGDMTHARATLERAQWILRGIPNDPSLWRMPGRTRAEWGDYLAWLGSTPSFRETTE